MSDTDSYTETEASGIMCHRTMRNMPAGGVQGAACVGSQCMAWRWSQSKKTQEFSQRVIEVAKEKDITWGKAHQWVLKHESDQFKRTEGYCGLAGYPHNSLRP